MPLVSKASRNGGGGGGRDKALPTPMGKSGSRNGNSVGNGNGYAREINGGGSGQGGLPSPPTSPTLAPANVRPMSSVLDDPFAAPRMATPPAMPRDPEMDGLGGRSKVCVLPCIMAFGLIVWVVEG